ncbi:MAG: hypothetical protein WC381_08410 [Kiritimatiellia bacterium]
MLIRMRAHYASVFAKATPDKLPDAAPARVLTHTLPARVTRSAPRLPAMLRIAMQAG